ncbi:MAG: Protein archease [Methanothrix sp.]|nr:MAG: Protein archease [Methanothrix sp.]
MILVRMKAIEYLEHTADVKFRARGRSLEEAFENAGLAMLGAMIDPATVRAEETWPVEIEADSLEALLYDWLSEILYLFEVELAAFSKFEVEIEEGEGGWRLSGRIRGERVDPERHFFDTEVKAVTLHQFEIKKEAADGGDEIWTAQVVLDV